MNLAKAAVVSILLLLAAAPTRPHAIGTSGPALLDWHNQHISRVVSASYSWNNLGVTALNAAGEVVTVDGKRCLRGRQFDLDVANEYAFDLDETVTLKLEIHQPAGNRLLVAYDKSDGLGHELVTLPDAPKQPSHVVTLSLPRAQLADRGDYGTDLMIAGSAVAVVPGGRRRRSRSATSVVERSYTTPAPAPHGWLDLTVAGADGSADAGPRRPLRRDRPDADPVQRSGRDQEVRRSHAHLPAARADGVAGRQQARLLRRRALPNQAAGGQLPPGRVARYRVPAASTSASR